MDMGVHGGENGSPDVQATADVILDAIRRAISDATLVAILVTNPGSQPLSA
jgi:hypothetical protein